ncbi:unnamed protein product [Cylindrotheca closterium]|uniref:TIR domain-containing protein n=1 Tax=Cylindrotheca closterium TaxID=2856 RepID=A0AAD2PVF1_9STRA|nr:unnamed protein product [Cylindrotheca closterium]
MEIYLSYSEQNQQTAARLKEDIEAYTSFVVALDHNDDWEEVEDNELGEHIHQADGLLFLATETSIITVWLIDVNKQINRNETIPAKIKLPRTIDISDSYYEEGFATLLGHIAQNMDRRYGSLHLQQEKEDDRHGPSHYENSLRDLFAKSKVKLDRTGALKARRQERACRKNRLQEARAQRLLRAYRY